MKSLFKKISNSCARLSPDSIITRTGQKEFIISHPNCILELNVRFTPTNIFVNGGSSHIRLSNVEEIDSFVKDWIRLTNIDHRWSGLFPAKLKDEAYVDIAYTIIRQMSRYTTSELITSILCITDTPTFSQIMANPDGVVYMFDGNIFKINSRTEKAYEITINRFRFKIQEGAFTLSEILDKLFPISVVRELKLKELV